jgi:hypothetical protein
MSAHPPPVPPEQRSPKETGGTSSAPTDEKMKPGYDARDRNLAQQGRQGAIKQNTTNKGFQQDR